MGYERLGKGACCWTGDQGGGLCLAPCPTQRWPEKLQVVAGDW